MADLPGRGHRPWWRARFRNLLLERQPRPDLDAPRRRGRCRLAEERRRDHPAEIDRVHAIQQVVGLRVELDAKPFVLAVESAHVRERIRVVAAHDADLRSLRRRRADAEAGGPADTSAEVNLFSAAPAVPADAGRTVVADRVAVLVAAGRDVVRKGRLRGSTWPS